jgi:hypothetical protein
MNNTKELYNIYHYKCTDTEINIFLKHKYLDVCTNGDVCINDILDILNDYNDYDQYNKKIYKCYNSYNSNLFNSVIKTNLINDITNWTSGDVANPFWAS